MQLEALRLGLRRRNPWEALDLGLVMLRQWRGTVYRAWFATFIPFALLVLALLWQWPMLATFFIWWLKPLFDRILLKVFSEASFGAVPTVREVWRALPSLLRNSGLIAGLTLRRFNPGRAFELPVWQLEGQTGKAGRARLRILSRRTSSYALWLMLVCTHIVVIFEFGLVGIVDLLAPSDGQSFSSWTDFFVGESSDNYVHVFNLAWLLAETIVEPFYVAAGFSLYLNRRSELEGWDIEVAFRRMSERLRQVAGTTAAKLGRLAMIAVLATSFSFLLVTPDVVRADELQCDSTPLTRSEPNSEQTASKTDPTNRPDGAIKKRVEKILADPVFGKKTEELSWRPRKTDKPEKTGETPWWAKKLIALADLLARGTRGLIYVVVLIAIAALLVVLYRYRHLVLGIQRPSIRLPETLFGLDLRPASLPADISAAALGEVDAGRYVAALSLLYRGTLVALIRRQHIEFRSGDTEDSCLRRVGGRIDADAAGYFAQLLDAWKRAAYAELPPDAESARDLCQRWAQHFAERGLSS